MLRSLGRTYGLIAVLAMAASGSAYAQTVSCSGIPAWTASTIYNPGDKLVYQNRLYEAKVQIWNAPPTHCTTCGWTGAESPFVMSIKAAQRRR